MPSGTPSVRDLDPGQVGVPAEAFPPIPDDALTNRVAARVDPRAWFPHPERPLEIEIGSGKGTFLVQQAPAQPGTNFLGIEYAREFYLYAADRVRRHGLANVRMLHTDAGVLFRWRLPDGVAEAVHLYFPDPWPKSRHHRRRMIQDGFLEDCHRVLRSPGEGFAGGVLRVVTDHADYWSWMCEHFARWTARGAAGVTRAGADGGAPFAMEGFEPGASAGEAELVGSNFERKYRLENRPMYACALRRR